MSLPVIVGATLLKTLDLVETGAGVDWLPLVLGTTVAYVSGIWAIKAGDQRCPARPTPILRLLRVRRRAAGADFHFLAG